MSEWVESPLNQLVTFQKGRKVDTSAYAQEGYDSYLGASGIGGRPDIDGYASTRLAVVAKPSDVLMLWDGERSGLVGYGKQGVVASTVSKLTPNSKVTPGFLFYTLAQSFDWIQNRRTGTGVPHVPKDLGRILRLKLPKSLIEQQKIAAILTSIDTAIEKTEALIEKYQQIKAGLMHDLFTRGVLPNGQLRPPREQTPELYQETAIGWIPKDWEVSGLAPKARKGTPFLRTGPFGSSLKGEHWVQYGHPVITIGALGEGDFLEEGLLFVGRRDATRLKDFQLTVGDVVFSRVADVGRSVVVRQEQAGWIMSSNLMRIAVEESLALPDFVQMQLGFDARVKRQIRAKVTGGGREVANSEVLSQLRFAWPAITEQGRIVVRANRVNDRLKSEHNRKAKLEAQKLGLMQDLLTGKVPVKVGAGETANG